MNPVWAQQNEDALAREVEDALRRYVGTDSFPTEEWPALARAFAKLVLSTEPVADGYDRTPRVTRALAEFHNALEGVINL